MALPKIDQPLFKMVLPSTKENITFRPLTVKEEKILLIAQETGETDQITTATKQVLNNCIQDFDVDEMTTFDIEWTLLNIRAKSINNSFEISVKDKYDASVDLVIDIKDFEIVYPEDVSNTIKVTDSISIVMKYPNMASIQELNSHKNENEIESTFRIYNRSVDMITDGDKIFKSSDFSYEEINDFLESLSSETLTKIKEYLDGMPYVYLKKDYKNSKGEDEVFEMRGLENFFG